MDGGSLENLIRVMDETKILPDIAKCFGGLSAVLALFYKDTRDLFVTTVRAAWRCIENPWSIWRHKTKLRTAAKRCTSKMLSNANYGEFLPFFAKQVLDRIEREFWVTTLNGAMVPILVAYREEGLLHIHREDENVGAHIALEEYDVLRKHLRVLVKSVMIKPKEFVPSGPSTWVVHG